VAEIDELLNTPPLTWWQRAYCRACRWRRAPKDTYREIRWGIQRWRRGYSDRDVWSMDHFLSSVIPPAFRQLRSELHGVPGHIAEKHDSVDEAAVEWGEILEKIAAGFEAWHTLFEECPRDWNRRDELQAKFDEGARLFVEHFGAFWD
jgi:hypothetical protein